MQQAHKLAGWPESQREVHQDVQPAVFGGPVRAAAHHHQTAGLEQAPWPAGFCACPPACWALSSFSASWVRTRWQQPGQSRRPQSCCAGRAAASRPLIYVYPLPERFTNCTWPEWHFHLYGAEAAIPKVAPCPGLAEPLPLLLAPTTGVLARAQALQEAPHHVTTNPHEADLFLVPALYCERPGPAHALPALAQPVQG